LIGIRSAILIDVATIGYARPPTFELQPPNSPTMEERIAYALLLHPTFRQAFIDEGMNAELSVGSVLKRIKGREQAEKGKEKGRRARKERSRL
jgi:hypothetical protein